MAWYRITWHSAKRSVGQATNIRGENILHALAMFLQVHDVNVQDIRTIAETGPVE